MAFSVMPKGRREFRQHIDLGNVKLACDRKRVEGNLHYAGFWLWGMCDMSLE